MDELIARLRRGPVYGDPRNVGERGELDEVEDDAAALCPFCAGEAVFEDHRPRGSCYYQCGLCGATSGFGSDTERDALTDWNTRA